MRDRAIGERGAAGEIEHVLQMLGTHQPLVVDGNVLEQVILVDVLA